MEQLKQRRPPEPLLEKASVSVLLLIVDWRYTELEQCLDSSLLSTAPLFIFLRIFLAQNVLYWILAACHTAIDFGRFVTPPSL